MKPKPRQSGPSRLESIVPCLSRPEAGQTLIETIIAIFVLVTALTSSLGLAVYVFSSSSLSQNEITASNLAREGIEVVRMMRDSNWLAADASSDTSFNLTSCADISGKLCYPKAYIGPAYNLGSGNERVVFDSSTGTWTLDSTVAYDLYLDATSRTYTSTAGTNPVFARMINVTFNSASPYTNQNSNQEMIVKSVVAWRGKNCTAFNTSQDLLALSTPCKVMVEEHMTNWKDYK